MFKTRTLLWLVAVPLLALLIACGGDDKDDSSSSSSNGDGGNSSSSSSGSSSSSSSNDGEISIENCKQYASFAAAAGSAFASTTGGAKFDKAYFDNLVKASPKEIKSDMQVIADVMLEYVSALEKIGVNLSDPSSIAKLDASKLQQLETAGEKLDSDKFQKAIDKVDAFFEKECS